MLTGAWSVLCIWTLMYVGLCALVMRRHVVRPAPAQPWPAVPSHALVMRPCAGREPHLQETLMSGIALRTDAPRALVHLVEEGDAAQPTAAGAAHMLQTLGIAAKMQSTTPHSVNHKAAQLAVYDDASDVFGVSVCIDSDVMLMPDTLAALCAPLADPQCGAAWLPFVQTGQPQTLGDRINGAILATSLQAFGVLRYLDEGHFVGKLVAIRPQALQQAGGWRAVSHVLGEDTTLSQKIAAAGWQVRCADALGYTPASGRTLRAVFERYARWSLVMRHHRPLVFWTYPLVVCPMPVLTCAWLAAAMSMPQGGAVYGATLGFVAVVLARLGLSFVGCRVADMPYRIRTQLLDAWLADLTLLAACTIASVRRSLAWRGRRLRYRGLGRRTRVQVRAAP